MINKEDMTPKQALAGLVPCLVSIGFLTNSLWQRLSGGIDGSAVFPSIILFILGLLIFPLMRKVEQAL